MLRVNEGLALPQLNTHVQVVGGVYRGSSGVLVKETDCRYKIRLVSGREVYLRKGNCKFDGDAGGVKNSLIQLKVVVIGGSYKGSTGVLVKETDCRYKVCLSTGKEVFLKKENVKIKLDHDHGRVVKELVKIRNHVDCLIALFEWVTE